jgi:hypothetical protein
MFHRLLYINMIFSCLLERLLLWTHSFHSISLCFSHFPRKYMIPYFMYVCAHVSIYSHTHTLDSISSHNYCDAYANGNNLTRLGIQQIFHHLLCASALTCNWGTDDKVIISRQEILLVSVATSLGLRLKAYTTHISRYSSYLVHCFYLDSSLPFRWHCLHTILKSYHIHLLYTIKV